MLPGQLAEITKFIETLNEYPDLKHKLLSEVIGYAKGAFPYESLSEQTQALLHIIGGKVALANTLTVGQTYVFKIGAVEGIIGKVTAILENYVEIKTPHNLGRETIAKDVIHRAEPYAE